jgi:broad specificity phosphatase PhoE
MDSATLHIGSSRPYVLADPPVRKGAPNLRGVPLVQGSDSVLRVYLVRHGRTPLNAAGLLRGRLDPQLDMTGYQQALALGDVIGRMDLSLVKSSPLIRAIDTASPIAERAGLEVQVDNRLIDRDYGPWSGKSKSELIAQWGGMDRAPDVESEAEVFARAMDVLNEIKRSPLSGAAVVVTHDAVIQLLLAGLDPALEDISPIPIDTGSFNVIEHAGGVWSVKSINNTPGGHDAPAVEQAAP